MICHWISMLDKYFVMTVADGTIWRSQYHYH
jgi:hypothetical protein